VEHPPKFELMINLTATMALGFEVPTLPVRAEDSICCGVAPL
jgi:hypothetical protein